MNDLIILKLALITSISGIILLFTILQLTPPAIQNTELNNVDDDTTIKITGKVISVNNRDNFSQIIVIHQIESNIIVFDSVNISNGNNINVEGKKDSYKGKSQIIADKIIKV